MISTRNLSSLPDIAQLKRLMQSLAMLDAILSPEWEYRSFSFNNHWAPGEQMGSMRNGLGDDYFALFNSQGVILKGFAHEARMSPYAQDPPRIWPGMLDQVPSAFSAFLKEPAFDLEATTFCIWRTINDVAWHHGEIGFPADMDPDGSEVLLSFLDGDPRTYQELAEYCYERSVDGAAVEHIYHYRILTREVVATLNSDVSFAELGPDIDEIGYPVEGRSLELGL